MISHSEGSGFMSKSRHWEAQMIGALKHLEAGREAEDVAREVGVSKHTIYAWKPRKRRMKSAKLCNRHLVSTVMIIRGTLLCGLSFSGTKAVCRIKTADQILSGNTAEVALAVSAPRHLVLRF